jgi:hypothetical protein
MLLYLAFRCIKKGMRGHIREHGRVFVPSRVGPEGIEPSTLGLKVPCSAGLSYRPGMGQKTRLETRTS